MQDMHSDNESHCIVDPYCSLVQVLCSPAFTCIFPTLNDSANPDQMASDFTRSHLICICTNCEGRVQQDKGLTNLFHTGMGGDRVYLSSLPCIVKLGFCYVSFKHSLQKL